jgi:nitrogen fixation/metabolism regulation signal transduction histidine kinase
VVPWLSSVQNNIEQRRFSNILINPRYQLKYVLSLSLLGLGLVAVHFVIFYGQIRAHCDTVSESELRNMMFKLGGLSLGFVAALSAIATIFTHRTAGPLHHFKQACNAIRAGRTETRIHLRPDDDFQDVAASFNDMMDSLTRGR